MLPFRLFCFFFPARLFKSILCSYLRTVVNGRVAWLTGVSFCPGVQPPVTFQPPPPPGSSNNNNNATSHASRPADKPGQPDLITRYNLKDKLNAMLTDSEGSGLEGNGKGGSKAWSSNREERQSLLQRRRDQMILEARRKMEAKIAAEKATAAGSG